MRGKLKFRVIGNAMADSNPKLECYAEGMTRILADVGGYHYKVTNKTKTIQRFIVNGEDGF
jgi:hypothetical protein